MAARFLEKIFAAFSERGADRYGETVTQLGHALQCAELARAEGAVDELVAAALLHDFGHLFEGRGDAAEKQGHDAHHEAYGARALRPWFSPAVTAPIALHVAAKRYLCAAEPGYFEMLSPASVLSLKLQGGPMTTAQQRTFERRPYADAAIRLRRWDDAGKAAQWSGPGLDDYAGLLDRIAVARA